MQEKWEDYKCMPYSIACKENLHGKDWVDNVSMSTRDLSLNVHYDMHGGGITLIQSLHGMLLSSKLEFTCIVDEDIIDQLRYNLVRVLRLK